MRTPTQPELDEGLSEDADAAPGANTPLVTALRQHDLAAAAELYDRYARSVRGIARRLLGADTELDDVVQDVFIAAITSIHRLRDPSLLKSWLLGIAVGKVRDNLRKRWRRRWLSFLPYDELLDLPAAEANAPPDIAHEVKSLLDQLPPEERLALLLHRLEGLSLEEAAAASNMTVSTFKRRLTRAETKFTLRAERRPALAEWLRGRPR
jgi:RNA polymerase sigma-70 factor (ECF subfamily)